MAEVVLGFVVKKRWKYEKEKDGETVLIPREKTISTMFLSRDAAETLRDLAEKAGGEAGELEVEFYVTKKMGEDGLSASY